MAEHFRFKTTNKPDIKLLFVVVIMATGVRDVLGESTGDDSNTEGKFFSLQSPTNDSDSIGVNFQDQAQPASGEDSAGDPEILWPGLIWGMRGFEKMPLPVSEPIYFEDPFIRTDFRLIYLYHDFPKGSQLRGGHLQTFALQIRLALTDRLAFIATKDGYTNLRATVLPEADGWNDFAVGLKYALAYDIQENEEWIFSGGLRWEWATGNRDVLQGDSQELSPFLSYAHRWNKFNFMTTASGRLPMDRHDSVYSFLWDAHFSYELFENFFPLIEFHGLHYLSDADRIPFSVDGLDYSNIGASNVAGHSAYWAGVGFRWQIMSHVSAGATYEFPLMDPDRDITQQRVTVNIVLSL